MAKQPKRSKKLQEADGFRAQVETLLNEPRTDWNDWEYDWLNSEARRREDYIYTDKERVILNRLVARARVFTHYSEHSVRELIEIAYQHRADLDEDSEAFVEEIYQSGTRRLRVREISRLAGIARLSYSLPYDKDVEDVMRQIWTQDDTELPPYVPYPKDAA
jgi:hypothetical protein